MIPGRTLKAVTQKVLTDQLIGSPICILLFFLTISVLEGETWEKTRHELLVKGKKMYLAEWIVWPPAQFFGFYVVPSRYRVTYLNIVSLGYDVYASSIRYQKEESVETK